MEDALETLLERLHVEQLDTFLFRGSSPQGRMRRVYGGQVLAQAMNAAIRTVESSRRVHSQHAYFLRPGDPQHPIIYEVDPIRDGKRFSTRRVVARQGGRAIFNTSLSFQVPEAGLEHQDPMPDVPAPETLEDDLSFFGRMAERYPGRYRMPRRQALDYRVVERADPVEHDPMPPHTGVWMRATGTLPDEPGIHETLLAYMSDNYLMSTALLPHGRGYDNPGIQTASIDHGLWFYDAFRADEWLYYDIRSPRAGRGRGFNTGSVYTRDGRLVAAAVQEGLMRLKDDED